VAVDRSRETALRSRLDELQRKGVDVSGLRMMRRISRTRRLANLEGFVADIEELRRSHKASRSRR
jgi:hypothetical protein